MSDVPPPLVLVADDDADIRRLVVIRLERAGYRVIVAADGAAALELAVAHRPDLAVLDVLMPGLTGLDVTRRLRETDSGSRLPILLLTARVQEDDVAQGVEAGADGYILKPFGKELVERVDELLRRAA